MENGPRTDRPGLENALPFGALEGLGVLDAPSGRFSADALRDVFGRNVREVRVLRRMRKKTLCNLAGISRPTLDAVESGSADPRLSTVVVLSGALDVDPAIMLVDHTGDPDWLRLIEAGARIRLPERD